MRDKASERLGLANDEDKMGNTANFKIVAVLTVALAGCSPNAIEEKVNDSQTEFAEIGDNFILSDNDIAALEKASAAGDAEASYDLFMHYTFSNPTSENKEKSSLWLSKAAEQGYEEAKALLKKK